MPDSKQVRAQAGQPHLRKGARNAIRNCLEVGTDDTVTLICDEASLSVAAALLEAIDGAGGTPRCFVLEQRARRPVVQLPEEIVAALENSTASIYTVHPIEGEYAHRQQLIAMVRPLNLRHAHMLRITEDAMVQGMLSDYRRVARLNEIMIERLGQASEIRVTSRSGTNLSVKLDPSEPWEGSAGVIRPGDWDNLPNGEILTCPSSVDGVYVCDGIAPVDYKVDRFDIGRRPLIIELAGGRLVKLAGGPGDMAEKVLAAIRGGRNTDRIGMFAIGTNFELLMPIGDPTQDMFVPGAYLSFGRPAGAADAPWKSSAQLTFSGRSTSLAVDGTKIISDGRYVPDIIAATEVPN